MKKNLKIGLIAFAGLLIIIFVTSIIKNKKSEKKESPAANQSISQKMLPIPSEKDEKMKIQTVKNDVIEVDNVYRSSLQKLSANGVAFENNEDFYIAYYPEDNGFLVVIQNSDFQKSREKAEKKLMEDLGINQEQICQIKVSITVPYDVNKEYSGKEYGISFCENEK